MPSRTDSPAGPHGRIAAADAAAQFLAALFDALWERYRQRVEHVAAYERVIAEAGATFVNDHIAFRTFACQEPSVGVHTLARIFDALGYRTAGSYSFEDKHLAAVHLQHPGGELPKLFISELRTWELSPDAWRIIERTLADHRSPLSTDTLAKLTQLAGGDAQREPDTELLRTIVREFHELPWRPPSKADVEALNQESQYAAWVLVHGYNVNHFTSLINSHGVQSLKDIERTVSALREAGVPMKSEIEGEPGSKLRQTATNAAVIDVEVRGKRGTESMPWTYAYFELAERGEVTDPETGERRRFEGFLGPQATQLFEMTRVKK
ncbi:MAG: DUF1338 domain-containing protein [Planctomycetes bacterium]|nr:DUF1338 domain-containing protein [Planctomycetota bacterium]